uniref:Uncharacterized protein n=1 Tax=Moniliophthora roreri TaxID=221103 RepID=A0A0W0ETN4_MONRR
MSYPQTTEYWWIVESQTAYTVKNMRSKGHASIVRLLVLDGNDLPYREQL